jgi:hypothetical protein
VRIEGIVLLTNWVEQRYIGEWFRALGTTSLPRAPLIVIKACSDPHVAVKEEDLGKRNCFTASLIRVKKERVPVEGKYRVCRSKGDEETIVNGRNTWKRQVVEIAIYTSLYLPYPMFGTRLRG